VHSHQVDASNREDGDGLEALSCWRGGDPSADPPGCASGCGSSAARLGEFRPPSLPWTEIDRAATDRAALVPVTNDVNWWVTSEHVGSFQTGSQSIGPLLSQLWVR